MDVDSHSSGNYLSYRGCVCFEVGLGKAAKPISSWRPGAKASTNTFDDIPYGVRKCTLSRRKSLRDAAGVPGCDTSSDKSKT